VFDWDSDGSSDLIGEFHTSLAELLDGEIEFDSTFNPILHFWTNYLILSSVAAKEKRGSYPLVNPAKKAKKKSYTSSGMLNVEYLRLEEEKSFLDYIQSGVQLHFTVAVDFTASNGDPNNPQSLHYRHPNMDNQYSLAIKAVGEIVQDYDTDKLFPALGFGARVPPSSIVTHEFFLNGNPQNPFCQGVQGILDAYHHALNTGKWNTCPLFSWLANSELLIFCSTVQLYGPTYFAPVINHVARFAAAHQDGRNYFILLILTDGIICGKCLIYLNRRSSYWTILVRWSHSHAFSFLWNRYGPNQRSYYKCIWSAVSLVYDSIF